MKGTPTRTVQFENADENHGSGKPRAKDTPELGSLLCDLSEGDYVTFVYSTPSNGGSLHRAGGTVTNVRHLNGYVDDFHVEIEDADRDLAGDTAYLHVSQSVRTYYYSDGGEDRPDDGWTLERLAWTPEEHAE